MYNGRRNLRLTHWSDSNESAVPANNYTDRCSGVRRELREQHADSYQQQTTEAGRVRQQPSDESSYGFQYVRLVLLAFVVVFKSSEKIASSLGFSPVPDISGCPGFVPCCPMCPQNQPRDARCPGFQGMLVTNSYNTTVQSRGHCNWQISSFYSKVTNVLGPAAYT